MTDETSTSPETAPVRRRRPRAVSASASSMPSVPEVVTVAPVETPESAETARPRRARRPRRTEGSEASPGLADGATTTQGPVEAGGEESGPATGDAVARRRRPARAARPRREAASTEAGIQPSEPIPIGTTESTEADGSERTTESEGGHAGRARRRRRRRARARGLGTEPVAPGTTTEASEALAREIAGTLQDGGGDASATEEGSTASGRRRRVRKRRRGKTAGAGQESEAGTPERPQQPAKPQKASRQERRSHKVSLARRAASMGLGTRRWSERWTDFLEYVGLGPRLKRGLEYARQGAVHDARMDEEGVLTAKVKGSLPEPYRVTFALVHLEDETWKATLREMADNAWWSTELLRGELPDDIDAAFAAAGASLYPTDGQEVLAQCTCPDLYNPCKHIAAVFYWLAGQFDKDPFILFRFRGRTREQVLQALTIIRSGGDPDAETVEEPVIAEDGPLEQRLDDFWAMGAGAERLVLQTSLPAQGVGNHLIRLDQPAGWEGRMGFILTMGGYYAALENAEDLRPYFATEGPGGPV